METTYVHPSGAAQLMREVLGLFKLRIGVVIMATALVGLAGSFAVLAGAPVASFFASLLQLSVLLLAAGIDAALR